LEDGTLVFLMTDDFRPGVFREYEALPDGRMGKLRKSGVYLDARKKLWYTRARDTGKRYWSEPFLGSGEPILALALSAPVFNKDGSFAGACDINLILTALSNFMQSLRLGDHGRAFILDTGGQLIAASGGMSPVVAGADGTEQRLRASEAGDPLIRDTARYLGLHPEIASASSARVFSFDDPAQGTVYAAVDRFEAPGGLAWIIVSALPASDFLGPVDQAAYLSLAIALIMVAAILALGLWSTRRALRPLTALTKAAQATAKGEWQEVPETRRKDEIGLLARAFNLMTVRLRETLDGLRQSEARFEEAQRMAHVGFWHRDIATNHIAWSDETYRIFGLTPQVPEITPARLQELIHPEDRQSWNESVTALVDNGTRYDVEYRVVRPDGELRIVHSQGDVTRAEAGRPVRIFGTVQDITERKRAEDGLREAQMELAHVNRIATMGQLSASIAHEVNQPVAAVLMNAGAALRWLSAQTPDLKEARDALGRIVKDAKRAGEIIDRIRALIKKVAPQKDRLDINEAVLEVVALTRSELLRDRVSLETQLAEDLPQVHGDRIQLQQVLLNLIVNAVEAMRGVGDGARELRVGTEKDASGGVLVAVRDTGPGLDPQSGGRLFEAFYTTKPSGMGMGLSICRAIIEAHGGRIWATANQPRGAAFQFTLPACAEDRPSAPPGEGPQVGEEVS
jgi:PAS domain S-box-containing protein